MEYLISKFVIVCKHLEYEEISILWLDLEVTRFPSDTLAVLKGRILKFHIFKEKVKITSNYKQFNKKKISRQFKIIFEFIFLRYSYSIWNYSNLFIHFYYL